MTTIAVISQYRGKLTSEKETTERPTLKPICKVPLSPSMTTDAELYYHLVGLILINTNNW